VHEQWSSQRAFLLAAIGSAVGLGNIWRFPYITGVNGGGAFVFIYCLCIFLIGGPLLMAEIAIGRRGGGSGIASMRKLTSEDHHSRFWRAIGWQAVLAPGIGLMYYSVVAGWTFDYALCSLLGVFAGADGESSGRIFGSVSGNPLRTLGSQGLFLLVTTVIVAAGVRRGLERAVRFLMPALFGILVALVVYSAVTADFLGALRFLFTPDFTKVTPPVVLMAVGQAFFSVNVATGAFITYGAYVPRTISIPRVAAIVAASDTTVALLTGLVIFPLVLSFGLEAGEGPGLVFVTLPIAFGNMPLGALFGALFFSLMAIAALTSAISMLEPIVSWLEERRGARRTVVAVVAAGVVWAGGVFATLSFNVLADFQPLNRLPLLEGKNIFDLMDFFVANLLIPAGGLLIALFAGWVMSKKVLTAELGLESSPLLPLWRFVVRFLAPVAIFLVLVANVG
jgi:NSS family neurotransmitter:Na+ symporter